MKTRPLLREGLVFYFLPLQILHGALCTLKGFVGYRLSGEKPRTRTLNGGL